MRWSCWPRRPDPAAGGPADPGPDHRGAAAGPTPRHRRPRPTRSRPRCAPSSWPSRRRWPPPTPRPSGPGRGPDHAERRRSRPCKARWRPILASTRTLRSTSASPDSASILGARVLGRVRRRPPPLRRRQGPQELRRHQPDHPRSPARRRSSWPATSTTTGSSTRCTPGLHRADRLTRRPRLLRPAHAPAARATTPPYASSPTASSASCTAASRPAPPTTSTPPGPTTKINKQWLDNSDAGGSGQPLRRAGNGSDVR